MSYEEKIFSLSSRQTTKRGCVMNRTIFSQSITSDIFFSCLNETNRDMTWFLCKNHHVIYLLHCGTGASVLYWSKCILIPLKINAKNIITFECLNWTSIQNFKYIICLMKPSHSCSISLPEGYFRPVCMKLTFGTRLSTAKVNQKPCENTTGE